MAKKPRSATQITNEEKQIDFYQQIVQVIYFQPTAASKALRPVLWFKPLTNQV